MECFICHSTENVVCSFPSTTAVLVKWRQILNIDSNINLRNKRLCVKHFEQKFHHILMDPSAKRGRFIFPIGPNSGNLNKNDEIGESFYEVSETSGETNKKSTESEIEKTDKKQINYKILLEIKDDEINDLKKKLINLQIENKKLKQELVEATKLSFCVNRVLQSKDTLSDGAKIFVKVLLRPTTNKYGDDEKSFFQNIYFKNPGAYKFLSKMIGSGIPSSRTLIRWQLFKNFNTGIIPEIMSYLKIKCKELTEQERNVVLICDEMDGKKGLCYDSARDMMIGYEDILERSPKLAKKFMVFMLRGFTEKLGNVVIASFATEKGVDGRQLSILIPYIIRELKLIGYNVIVTNFDQSGPNRRAFSLLGVTTESPYFFVDSLKIFAMFDIPHLFKSVSIFISII